MWGPFGNFGSQDLPKPPKKFTFWRNGKLVVSRRIGIRLTQEVLSVPGNIDKDRVKGSAFQFLSCISVVWNQSSQTVHLHFKGGCSHNYIS